MICGWVNGQTWSHRYSGPIIRLYGLFDYVGVGAPIPVLFKGQLDNTSVLQIMQPQEPSNPDVLGAHLPCAGPLDGGTGCQSRTLCSLGRTFAIVIILNWLCGFVDCQLGVLA